MNEIKKYISFFAIGGIGYAMIELAWRRRTHISMVLAGGICFMLFSVIARRLKGYSLVLKASVCAIMITIVELIFGLVFNVMLGMKVWDYSEELFNFKGQICPLFTFMWWGLSLIFLPLADLLNERLGEEKANLEGI